MKHDKLYYNHRALASSSLASADCPLLHYYTNNTLVDGDDDNYYSFPNYYGDSTNENSMPIHSATVTYVTNYIMVFIAIVSAITVWFKSPGKRDDLWIVLFFLCYGIGNIIHSFINDEAYNEEDGNEDERGITDMGAMIMTILAYFYVVISYSLLLCTGIKSLPLKNKIVHDIVRDLSFAATAIVLILVAFRFYLVSYVWGGIVGLIMICIFFRSVVIEQKNSTISDSNNKNNKNSEDDEKDQEQNVENDAGFDHRSRSSSCNISNAKPCCFEYSRNFFFFVKAMGILLYMIAAILQYWFESFCGKE